MFDITCYYNPEDPSLEAERAIWKDIYAWKYAICGLLKPDTIFEVGVRAGYTASAFLCACPEATYYGIDADNQTYGGSAGMVQYAKKMLAKQFPKRATVEICDSRLFTTDKKYDLVNVDGDHSLAGCYKDLCLAESISNRWILVDDIFHHPESVPYAIDHFMEHKPYSSVVFPTPRGDCLIDLRPSISFPQKA